MLDIKLIRTNPELVKENIKKKFQDEKLPLVDEVVELDQRIRELKLKGDSLRQERNSTSDEIGALFREKKVDEANAKKQKVVEINEQLVEIEKEENELSELLIDELSEDLVIDHGKLEDTFLKFGLKIGFLLASQLSYL